MCDTVRLDFTVRTGETCKAKYRANCCCYKVKCATTYITNDKKKVKCKLHQVSMSQSNTTMCKHVNTLKKQFS